MKKILISLLFLSLWACSGENPPNTSESIENQPAKAETTVNSELPPAQPEAITNIQRIKIATVGTKDVGLTAALYSEWLNYKIVEEGVVSEELAISWGTPAVSGKPYALMQGESGDDVYLRAIQVTVPDNYSAMNSYGWNAIEIIVEDPDSIYEKLLKSPFEHVGGPANLGGNSSIRAVQFKGLSEEVFYFTTETGDRSKSSLLTPRADIDRPFIMVVAGPDARELTDFYVSNFGAKEAFFIKTPINIVAAAQGMASDHLYTMGFVRLGEFSHSIEIDGYPETTGPRQTAEGELPPGVSITSFSVSNLDLIDPGLFVSVPVTPASTAYQGNRTATIVGPAGELIELIEEKQ